MPEQSGLVDTAGTHSDTGTGADQPIAEKPSGDVTFQGVHEVSGVDQWRQMAEAIHQRLAALEARLEAFEATHTEHGSRLADFMAWARDAIAVARKTHPMGL